MPGYVRGFVEREFGSGWEFVCRVDPFTGSQGAFKYVLFGTDWASPLDPVVHTSGFPEDLAPNTKLAMLGRYLPSLERLSDANLDERFRTFREHLSDRFPRHVPLEDLLAYDWDRGIDEGNRAALAERWPEGTSRSVFRLFELVDADGVGYDEWAPGDAGGWRRRIADRGDDEVEELLRGGWTGFDGRTVTLRARSRRAMLPEGWFDLLDLLAASSIRDVRLVFYWHH